MSDNILPSETLPLSAAHPVEIPNCRIRSADRVVTCDHQSR
jgi:hypothetical protein